LADRLLVDAVLNGPDEAAIPEREKALFAFLARVNKESFTLRAEDVKSLKHVGWSEESIYDAVTVCALFNFYNRWCDASGVHVMPPEAHALGGKRMAMNGYLPPPED
jgi:alkylhydroperoxidase family enzyme